MSTLSTSAPKSSDDSLFAGLAYLGGLIFFIPTIIIFALKKDESDFIKYHCLQALSFGIITLINIVLQIVIWTATAVAGVVPGLNILVAMIAGIVQLVITLLMLPIAIYMIFICVKAFMGETVRVPVVADKIDEKFGSSAVAQTPQAPQQEPPRPDIIQQ